MLLHTPHSSSEHPCNEQVCKYLGHKHNHLCVATGPLWGMGAVVDTYDLPAKAIESYSYEHPFRVEHVVFYAVPKELLTDTIVRSVYFDVYTGQKWNEFTLNLYDKDLRRSSMLWLSRPGAAVPELVAKDSNNCIVKVTLTDLFDPLVDYLIIEDRWPPINGHKSQRWVLKLIAGTIPQWAVFGWAWKLWVNNPEVRAAAIDHIVQTVPAVAPLVKNIKQSENQGKAWNDIHNQIGKELSIPARPFSIQTVTAVLALPMKIAMRIGWAPTIPVPEYQPPGESGRVLLADKTGTFPATH